jgi:hypothetical protein
LFSVPAAASWRVHGARGSEEPMPEAGLRDLEVNAIENERRCVRSAEHWHGERPM